MINLNLTQQQLKEMNRQIAELDPVWSWNEYFLSVGKFALSILLLR